MNTSIDGKNAEEAKHRATAVDKIKGTEGYLCLYNIYFWERRVYNDGRGRPKLVRCPDVNS